MGADKFKFISPGVFIEEIDESNVPSLPDRMGPLVIGRFSKGPSMRPVRVNSYKEFASMFGAPAPGNASGDIWRTGDETAPTYAAYAVQAWLRNNSPCTVYRVIGEQASNNDASTAGLAGWATDQVHGTTFGDTGGAFGLFVYASGTLAQNLTGTLAAVWYLQDGAVMLKGNNRGNLTAASGTCQLIKGTSGAGAEFTAQVVKDSTDNIIKEATFNFDRDSDKYIRKVFNTDPTKTNGDLSNDTVNYWLGETFDSNLRSGENTKLALNGGDIADSAPTFGIILPLEGKAGLTWGNRQQQAKAAQTGWFISQDNRGGAYENFIAESHTEKLFKLIALDSGESANRDLKISISDIKAPSDNFNKFGTFTVEVRSAYDTDNKPQVLEQYTGCNLDPISANYIGRKIGDVYYSYNETDKRIVEHGSYPNNSSRLRVEVSSLVSNGGAEGLLPFGVFGPVVPATVLLTSASRATDSLYAAGVGKVPKTTLPLHLEGVDALSEGNTLFTNLNMAGDKAMYNNINAVTRWPTARLRVSSSEGNLPKSSRAYFGYASTIKDTKRFDQTNFDLLRGAPAEFDPQADPGADTNYSWVFTLDDVMLSAGNTDHAYHHSGSRGRGLSFTISGSKASGDGSNGTYKTVLDEGYNKFTSPMFGGFDGFDVTEKDPLRNSYMSSATTGRVNSSFYSLKKAIDIVSDKDFVEFDVLTAPGITNSTLNASMVDACEDRADALAIIDVEGGYQPPHERNVSSDGETSTAALGSVTSTVDNLKTMGINSSYGCTFYPWVKVRDNINNAMLYVPPSVVALGTFSSSQRKSAVWFAPAGFTRGGLSEGSAGLPVIGVRQRLTSSDRDKLYDANINPIASFPAEGIVVFGQKTLQVTASALDRINVRRLLIHVKKEISRISSTLLFEQNVQATWDRFIGQVEPFLGDIKAGQGLSDFKVVLDDTTTTPDLIDRNILYAKIFLKPARAIEFIALDFVITRSGASFDD